MKKSVFVICVVLLLSMLMSACTESIFQKEDEDMNENAAEMRIEELIITSGDKEIYGKIYYPASNKKCPAVILSHGYNGCHTDFLAECKYFADNGFIAYTFDFCGGSTRSRSSGKSTDMTIFTERDDLLAVIDYISELKQVDEERVFLLGGSQGGLVSALAAEERTEQVRGMVLYFPAFNIPDDWRRNYPNENQIPETVDFWGLNLGRGFFTEMREFDTYENIGDFENEILILHGDKDTIAPLAASRKAIQEYEYAEVVIMYGEGHGFSPAGAKTAMEKALGFMQGLS